MPVNAPAEYFKAEDRYQSAKSREEKIVALEEMIRLMPKHHGSEAALAQLKSRLAKLKKETGGKKSRKTISVAKEGDAQICLIGRTQSGKSYLLSRLTDARPKISSHPYTTTKPEVGMMDYRGIKIQIVEIPSTFLPEYMSIARTTDAIVLVGKETEKKYLESVLANIFIRTKRIIIDPRLPVGEIKENIWNLTGLMVVYSKKTNTPMALPIDSTIKKFALRVHKDFVANFSFARVIRGSRIIQAGLNYRLQDGDVVEIHTK